MKETYKKPRITIGESERLAYPAVALGAFLAALAKGKIAVDSTHTQKLNRRADNK
ncbi:MAG: hypothetical protein IJU91_06220 [Selenomonadaceae bacterium]|nr:hypothetical protein [Selenomonadaceae bacterium]